MGKRGPQKTTTDFKKHIGNVEIHKGSTAGGMSVVSWDAIPQCEEETCRIFDMCPYDKAGKCRVRKEYISYIERLLLGQIDEKHDMARFRLGMEIIPLFLQLITMKIHSHGASVTYLDKNGNIRMNPIHRELRACIKSVQDGLNGIKDAFPGGEIKGVENVTGSTDYYSGLFEGAPEEEDFKMRNRV